jgi:hypothetical protein
LSNNASDGTDDDAARDDVDAAFPSGMKPWKPDEDVKELTDEQKPAKMIV